MKLSSMEKIILAVFLAVVIIAVGVFLLILPEYNKIEPNTQALAAAQAEREQLYDTLAREATIDTEIQDALDDANKFSMNFYEDMTTYEADVLIREILEATNMSTDSLSIGDFTTSTLTVSDYVETVVNYPLKDYATGTGNAEAAAASDTGDVTYDIQYDESGNIIIPDSFKEAYPVDTLQNYLIAVLSTRSQTLGAITLNFTVEGTRGDFLAFLDYVAGLEKATYINSTTIAYTAAEVQEDDNNGGNGGNEQGEEDQPAPAAENPDNNNNNNNNNNVVHLGDRDKITAPISITFFCAEPLSEAVAQG